MKSRPGRVTYLITGAAGFIGSNFVRYLFRNKKDIRVRVLDKLTYAGNPENVKAFEGRDDFEFIRGDICDKETVRGAMQDAQVVVNFAAESAVDRSIDRGEEFLYTDVVGVYVLLEEARKQKGLHKFVQVSTDEVYGEIREGSFRETDETKPRNPYAAAKLGGDRLAHSFYATYKLPVIVTRASNNFGPRCYPEKVIPLFITNLLEGKKVPLYGEGKQVRDWLHVEDHCRGIDRVVENGEDGETYNIGGTGECSNLDLTRLILRLTGKDESSIKYVMDRPGHDFRYSLDCSKLRALGWKPDCTMEEGMKETIAWYRDHEDWWRPLKDKMDRRYVGGFWGEKKT